MRLSRRAVWMIAPSVLGVMLLGAAPASAAPSDGVLVSTDGVTWEHALPNGLFTDLSTLVPGGSETASLFVKNDSPTPANLRISAMDVTTSSEDFEDALTVSASTPTSRPHVLTLDRSKKCMPLIAGEPLAAGAVVKVDIAVGLAETAGNTVQDRTASMNILVGLFAEAPVHMPNGCDEALQLPVLALPSGDEGMPVTGSAILMPALAGASVLFGVGAFLLLGRRRRRVE